MTQMTNDRSSLLRMLPVALFVLVAGFFAIALRSGDPSRLPSTMIGKAVPPSNFPALEGLQVDGKPIPGFTNTDLADGKVKIVNFWASWCAPCRKELPALDRLNRDFGGERFTVATIATGRNTIPAIIRLFEETGVESLPLYLDKEQALAREMGVLGLPVTVILDPEGREIARMTGDAEWDGESARAIVAALLAAD